MVHQNTNLRLQNGSPQTSGWCHRCYGHYLYSLWADTIFIFKRKPFFGIFPLKYTSNKMLFPIRESLMYFSYIQSKIWMLDSPYTATNSTTTNISVWSQSQNRCPAQMWRSCKAGWTWIIANINVLQQKGTGLLSLLDQMLISHVLFLTSLEKFSWQSPAHNTVGNECVKHCLITKQQHWNIQSKEILTQVKRLKL